MKSATDFNGKWFNWTWRVTIDNVCPYGWGLNFDHLKNVIRNDITNSTKSIWVQPKPSRETSFIEKPQSHSFCWSADTSDVLLSIVHTVNEILRVNHTIHDFICIQFDALNSTDLEIWYSLYTKAQSLSYCWQYY